jgi:uncharacterized protein DUF992
MRGSLLALLGATALFFGAAANAQQPSPTPARPGAAPAGTKGINVGSLSCNVAGGIGFVFGSTKTLNCIFTRSDGLGERYEGAIKRFGVDVGYTKDAHIVWLVFAPGNIASGSLAGSYGGVTVQGTVGVGAGANILVGGSNRQISLQPVSVEGSVGLNLAGGVAEISLARAP